MIRSGGALVKSVFSEFTPLSWNGIPQPGITLAPRWGSYAAIYERHLWVAVLVNKIANATARLPLKVYRRADNGRPEADGPYAELLRRPHPEIDPFLFWLWVQSTIQIYGEAFLLKVRDAGGRPVMLRPWHPTLMHDEVRDGRVVWEVQTGTSERVEIARRDFVHFRLYNPQPGAVRGMSPMEPLRWTLENEEGARRANSAIWRNGARPAIALRHPGKLTAPAAERLRSQWQQVHSGVENFGKTAVLEEGMEAQVLSLSSEELQYVESRRLNREECCAAYDVPPPVVHILDRATFSNITEQMRSMYRDTMAPKIKLIESTLHVELRDGRFGDPRRDPDFSEDVYAEFLMDEVLRGSFEVRVAAMAQAIQTGQMMPSEARELENRPFVEGSDVLFINAAVVPVDQADTVTPGASGVPAGAMRSVMGRLSRHHSVADIDGAVLTAGLNGHSERVLAELDRAKADGVSVPEFRNRLRALEA